MAKINDGGPAFGHAAENGHCCGATLRDYFAAKVLPEIWRCAQDENWAKHGPDYREEGIAHEAYRIADAMLAARSKGAEAER